MNGPGGLSFVNAVLAAAQSAMMRPFHVPFDAHCASLMVYLWSQLLGLRYTKRILLLVSVCVVLIFNFSVYRFHKQGLGLLADESITENL